MSGATWRLTEQQRFQGVADALDLLRDEARRLRDLRQPQAVSWRRLDDEIERLAAGLHQGAAANAGVEQRIAALSEQAAILADTVREIALEEHDQAGADLQFWADAVRACIEGHQRDLGQPLAGIAGGAATGAWRTPRGRWP